MITVDRPILDLKDQNNVDAFLKQERPDIVIIAAGKVGGIAAHKAQPADFILDNLIISTNIIQSSLKYDIGTLVHVASSAVYPADAECPIKEEALLSGRLDPTHEAYAVAKIAGIATNQAIRQQHGRNFFSVLPCNLYGPGANFDSATSHFLPGLIRRAHEAKLANAKELTAWGTGKPRREVLYVDDCADAIAFLLENDPGTACINIGAGEDHTIETYLDTICDVVGYGGSIAFDSSKPDGVSRRLMDSGRLNELGWRPRTGLRQGIKATYSWFLQNFEAASAA